MNKTEIRTCSAEETAACAGKLSNRLKPGDVVCLYGDLGVGKTVFSGGLLAALGVTEPVTSPTFTLVNEYESDRFPVCHFDLYRIEDEDELYQIGFDDYLAGEAVCLIEWPENAGSALPKKRLNITIRRDPDAPDTSRIITIEES